LQAADEFASYFTKATEPKIFITTSVNRNVRKPLTKKFIDDLLVLIPNSEFHERGQYNLKARIFFFFQWSEIHHNSFDAILLFSIASSLSGFDSFAYILLL